MLTPLDLTGKTFSKGFRGFDTGEVNSFLAQVSREYERLYQDNVELKDTVERVSAKLEYYQRMEGTMQNTLVVAQETADEVKKSSEQKAAMLTRETEIECRKQQDAAQTYCNKLKSEAEADAIRLRSEADAYAEKVRKEADEYAAATRGSADDYGKLTRTDADSYAASLRDKTDTSTGQLKAEAQSFVEKMKSMAEIEVARMKVATDDSCKTLLADSREKARVLVAEASAHANQVMADANQQSQTIVSEASRKSQEMIAAVQKQSQDMVAEAMEKSQHLVSEATERSRKMIYDATERSQKMVFIAEAKASAAMDTYKTLVNKANSQSQQLKNLLQSQLSLFDSFEAEHAVDELMQPKLQAIKQADPVVEAETVKEQTAAEKQEGASEVSGPIISPDVDTAVSAASAQESESAEAETVAQEDKIPSMTWEQPEQDKDMSVQQEAAEAETSSAAITEQETDQVPADGQALSEGEVPVSEAAEAAEGSETSEPVRFDTVEEFNAVEEEHMEENPQLRKSLFTRFKPRTTVFNRNGFPRKNADLRVTLTRMQQENEVKEETGPHAEDGAALQEEHKEF